MSKGKESLKPVSVDSVKPGKMDGMILRSILTDYAKDKLAVFQAMTGDHSTIIEMLETGHPLGPFVRGFLIEYLRGNIKRPKGNIRTLSSRASDLSFLVNVVKLMCERQISENAAINLLVDADAETKKARPLGLDTARSILKRAKKDAPDLWPIKVDGKLLAPWEQDAPKVNVGEQMRDLLTK